MAKKKSEISFEDKLSRLEEISDLLESETIGIEESIILYEEGVKLSKECLGSLEKATVKITELKNDINVFKDKEEIE